MITTLANRIYPDKISKRFKTIRLKSGSMTTNYDLSEFNIHEGKTSHEEFSTESEDPEQVAMEYYQSKGYDVERLTYKSVFSKLKDETLVPQEVIQDVNTKVEQKYGFELSDDDFMGGNTFFVFNQRGVPDLLIIDQQSSSSETKYCFVEVKREGGQLRHSQVRWLTFFDCLPSKVVYVEPASKHTYVDLEDMFSE